jgi:hypothetical protein
MAYSEAERERRRQQCLKTKPWEKSTGARTERGKAIVSQNALKTGLYSSFEPFRVLARLDIENEAMARIRAIVLKQKQAYENSNAKPHSFWEQVFEGIDDDDFLKELRNSKC